MLETRARCRRGSSAETLRWALARRRRHGPVLATLIVNAGGNGQTDPRRGPSSHQARRAHLSLSRAGEPGSLPNSPGAPPLGWRLPRKHDLRRSVGLELDDIQSGALHETAQPLRGYLPAGFASTDPTAGVELVRRLSRQSIPARPTATRTRTPGSPLPSRTRLKALGVPQDSLDSLAPAFPQGMAAQTANWATSARAARPTGRRRWDSRHSPRRPCARCRPTKPGSTRCPSARAGGQGACRIEVDLASGLLPAARRTHLPFGFGDGIESTRPSRGAASRRTNRGEPLKGSASSATRTGPGRSAPMPTRRYWAGTAPSRPSSASSTPASPPTSTILTSGLGSRKEEAWLGAKMVRHLAEQQR